MTSSIEDGVTTRYTYAGTDQNQLLTETTDGVGAYGYIYGGADSQGVPIIVGQSTAGAGTSSVISDPVTGQPLNLTTADGVTGLYVVNGIGNQVGLLTDARTTAFQVAYSPYGAQNVTAGSTSDEWVQNPYGFKNGNRTDNGVLVKFGMRWYLAITGTWTQRDTLDAPLDPKNANRYGYAGGDPINGSDPTGRLTAGQGVGLAGNIVSDISTFIPGPVGLVGGLVGTGLSVGGALADGDSQGALVAGAYGTAGALFGVAGRVAGASYGVSTSVGLGYTALGNFTNQVR